MIDQINAAVILKIIITVFLTGVSVMNFKILWDWFTAPKANRNSIEKAKDELCNARQSIMEMNVHLEALSKNLENLSQKLDNLSVIITGGSNPTDSIVFRLAQIEGFIETLKTAN